MYFSQCSQMRDPALYIGIKGTLFYLCLTTLSTSLWPSQGHGQSQCSMVVAVNSSQLIKILQSFLFGPLQPLLSLMIRYLSLVFLACLKIEFMSATTPERPSARRLAGKPHFEWSTSFCIFLSHS